MSDRREDLSTANVKCYIYNSKTTIPASDPIVIENTGTVLVTGTTTITGALPNTNTTPHTT